MSVGRVTRLVVLLVTAVVVAVLAARLDERRILASFAGVDWGWVAFAALINIGNTTIEAWRWTQVASPLGPNLRVRSAFLAIVSGVAGGLLLPFKLGDGVKAYVFARAEGLRVSQAVGTVVADRLADLLAFAIVALGVWLTVPLPGRVGTVIHSISGGLAAVLAVVVGLSTARPLRRWLQADRRSRFAARAGRGLDALARFGRTLPIARVAAASFASWLVRATVVWAMMRAFHLPLPPTAALVTLIVINVGIAVTGVPGNVGSFELATVGALGIYSVPLETGVSYGIALHATEMLPLLALGIILALTGAIDVSTWWRVPSAQTDAS
jgi:glycosyltransferase 2 family protein